MSSSGLVCNVRCLCPCSSRCKHIRRRIDADHAFAAIGPRSSGQSCSATKVDDELQVFMARPTSSQLHQVGGWYGSVAIIIEAEAFKAICGGVVVFAHKMDLLIYVLERCTMVLDPCGLEGAVYCI